MSRKLSYRNFFFALLAVCLGSSCKKENNEVITRSFTVAGFNEIYLEGPFEVELVQDTIESIEFTGVQRNIETCSAIVSDSILIVDGRKHGEYLHPSEANTKVIIHVRTLRYIEVQDDCKIRSSNALGGNEIGVVVKTRYTDLDLILNCQTFYHWSNTNAVNIKLSGTVDRVKLWPSGLSQVDATALQANYAEVVNGSQNDIKVRSSLELLYSLTSVGNIIYYGNPVLVASTGGDGRGQLIKGD